MTARAGRMCNEHIRRHNMTETEENILAKTILFVKDQLAGAEAGHDWFHIERVYKTAQTLSKTENGDPLIIALGALLHDIADPKFHGGDEEKGPKIAGEFLKQHGVDPEKILHVQQIIRHISFKNSFDGSSFNSHELTVVRDADRLDAIGAIGIARAFTYGGFKNRLLYDPEILPDIHHSKETYKNTAAPTINHFYEKLLLLKDMMHTDAGKKMAEARHNFMETYLAQFYAEWEGEC